jgi:dTDP-L-rhamnose 4-epimerase
MSQRVLITGGAGFIGSHLADALLHRGHAVRALDNLAPQVHGPERARPAYLHRDVELMVGDVRDRAAVERAIDRVDAVYHFASAVGVGQSMYEIEHYTSVNNLGTAVLMEALVKKPVRRLVVASSMSIYGEGLYRDAHARPVEGAARGWEQLTRGEWSPRGPEGEPLEPLPTPEWKRPCLESVYALSKYDQERMCLMLGRAYGIPTCALRFFNVYGPRQALSNPYTGVMAIFASRLLNDRRPLIFEDGEQRRSFVSVKDVVQACMRALEVDAAAGREFNISGDQVHTVRELADGIAAALGKRHLTPEVTGKYRVGDVRHCFADIRAARTSLDYTPQVRFADGVAELVEWLRGQVAHDRVQEMQRNLAQRGLTL